MPLKNMFDHPLSLEGIYPSYNDYFHSKMQDKNYLRVHWQKKAQQAWKIAQTCLRIFPTIKQGIVLLVAKCHQVGVNLKSGTLPCSLSWIGIWKTQKGKMKNTEWKYEKHRREIWKKQNWNMKNTAGKYGKHRRET